MQFDDRLMTVLGQDVRDSAGRTAAWRQLIDLLAQMPADRETERGDNAFQRLRELRPDIPRQQRRAAAAALAGRPVPAALIAFFGEDDAAIAAPAIAGARLPDAEWIALIPALTPVSRALLRHRRDLGARVKRALASYGASDLIIASAVEAPMPARIEPTPPDHRPPNIADLVARIEAFRADRGARPARQVDLPTEEIARAFRYETDPAGTIDWCEGMARADLIGLSIAVAAIGADGVDGHVAGAFRRRAPFRDARLSLAGDGATGGEWQLSGVPFFEVASGRFLGFRGTGRRPRPDERAVAPAVASGLYGSGLPADSLRQLAHEIRTPLNAIIGFAEMIDRQILGPAAADYRGRAGAILGDARRLLTTVDDLDTAARLDAGVKPHGRGPVSVDLPAILRAQCRDIAPLAETRGVSLGLSVADDLPVATADKVSVERMFARLLASTVGLAGAGEEISVRLDADPASGLSVMTIDRARAIAGRDERALLDPGYSPDGDWPDAPVLGLGFALRLVRNLAEAAGGRLSIEPDRFVLILAGASDSPGEREEQA